jgi:hypothetical protein
MLAQDMSGEAVGVGAGAPFGLGEQVHLPVRLLEGLGHDVALQPGTPRQYNAGFGIDRVPE